MTTPDDIEALAAEYVLGTCDQAERIAVAARRLREPDLDAAIMAWERRLAPLGVLLPPVAPPADLLARIDRRLDRAGAPDPRLRLLQQRVTRWRAAALVASAIAAGLVGVIALRDRSAPPQTYVAVFQKDDVSPAFVMTVDLASRTLAVRRVAADAPAGKTYELWIVSDKLGDGPQSLGLVDDATARHRRALSNLDPAILRAASFGVSLEPAGGSPTGKPTGPVLQARLLSTTP